VFRGINSVRFTAAEWKHGNPSDRFTSMFRSCGTVLPEKCQLVRGADIPELDLVGVNGTRCYCTTDLCNGPDKYTHNSAPALVIRRLTASFIAVISLLAWITARFLGQ